MKHAIFQQLPQLLQWKNFLDQCIMVNEVNIYKLIICSSTSNANPFKIGSWATTLLIWTTSKQEPKFNLSYLRLLSIYETPFFSREQNLYLAPWYTLEHSLSVRANIEHEYSYYSKRNLPLSNNTFYLFYIAFSFL